MLEKFLQAWEFVKDNVNEATILGSVVAASLLPLNGCVTTQPNPAHLGTVAEQSQEKEQKIEEEGSSETDYPYSTRLGVENTVEGDTNLLKTTFGIAPSEEGKHGEEFLRAYNYAGNLDYAAIGLILPSFRLGDAKNQITLFGTFGDKQGLGIQSKHDLKNLTLILNAEQAKTQGEDPTRLGFGLDYKLNEKLTLGGGFDRVNGIENVNYFLAHTILNHSETDQFGLGVRLADSDEDLKKKKSIAAFWCHYGKDEKWGTRTWLTYDWGNNFDTLVFDSIIAQNPTFGDQSSPWIVGRGFGDMYDVGVVENALTGERVPLGVRTSQGWVGELKAVLSDRAGTNSGLVRGDIGYTFKPVGRVKPSLTAFYQHGLGQNNVDAAGGSVLLSWENFCLEASTSQPVSGNGKDNIYVGVQYSCPIPIKR